MNANFFAVVWNTSSPRNCEAATRVTSAVARLRGHLIAAVRLDGLHFYVSKQGFCSPPIHLIPERTGFTYGTLFSRRPADITDDAPFPRASLDASAAAKIMASHGEHLAAQYWGHHLAFLVDRVSGDKWIFRSPTCHQPCLLATYQGVRLYFSAAEDCARLGIIRFTINWQLVAAFAASTRITTSETGLNEMAELTNGGYHRIHRNAVHEASYWNPARIARSQAIEDPVEAKRALRTTTRACVSTWAAEHPNILQRLSGGIDSSIVTACLSAAPSKPTVTCLNYHSRGTFGDERHYARSVAERAGFRLIEYSNDSSASLAPILTFPRTESPSSYMSRSGFDRREADLARDLGATARFTGIMGDMLFQMPAAAPSVADHLQRHGIAGQFFRLALQAAQTDRVSLWAVLGNAFAKGLLTRPHGFQPGELARRENSLLTMQARDSVFRDAPLRFIHPWLHDLRGVPYGKFPQIAGLSFNSAYFNVLHEPDESELVHPFISEPLMELCLRLPTYVLLRDGWDRALAREAFEADLPHIVKTRTTKGSTVHHFTDQIHHNADFIRDLLSDGVLVREGILDPKKVADCLPGKTRRSNLSMGPLIASIAAEAWLRVWTERPIQYAA